MWGWSGQHWVSEAIKDLGHRDFVLGFVLALIAFALAAAWDEYKARRDRRARQRVALIGLREEMAANYSGAENNLNLIAVESRDLNNEGEPLINPLNPLETA